MPRSARIRGRGLGPLFDPNDPARKQRVDLTLLSAVTRQAQQLERLLAQLVDSPAVSATQRKRILNAGDHARFMVEDLTAGRHR